ncbi:MAG: hypothetical protein M9887_08095 [Chitinophagales bacterium]|nr:hypothetical protein [Chitinophagales bacterium]
MKNKFLKMMILGALIVSTVSCKKDKNENPIDPPPLTNELQLEGKWVFESLEFLNTSEVSWKEGLEVNTENTFGYAPVMFSDMMGFDFQTKAIESGKGNKFNFINDGDRNQDETKEYWYWNYLNEKQSFEIGQINSQLPPYDFGIHNIKNIVLNNDGNTIDFDAELTSRVVGGKLTETIETPVHIVIKRGESNNKVNVTIGGTPLEQILDEFQNNEDNKTNAEKMIGTSWKLSSGSTLYNPGLSDVDDPDQAYLKIIALSLDSDNNLLYRYSYPLGVVAAKTYPQEQTDLDQDIINIRMGDGNRTPYSFIKWKIQAINVESGTIQFEDIETGTVRDFVKIDNINIDFDKEEYNQIK